MRSLRLGGKEITIFPRRHERDDRTYEDSEMGTNGDCGGHSRGDNVFSWGIHNLHVSDIRGLTNDGTKHTF